MRIKCGQPNIPVLLKLENPSNGGQSVQVAATTTAAVDVWQTLTFDFTSVTIADGVPYTRLDLFPGYDGTAAVNAMCYMDDLVQVMP